MSPLLTTLLTIGGLLAAVLTVFSIILFLFQRRMIYRPYRLDRSRPELAGYANEEIRFERDRVTLHGWLLDHEAGNLLIYYGGNAEELSYCHERFREIDDLAVLLVNYRGYGESGGEPTETGLIADALALYDHYRPGYRKVALCGRSLGSGIAVRVAAERGCDALVLVTPYDSIAAVGQSWFWYMPVKYLVVDRYEALKHAAEIRCPTLVLLAEQDRVVPHARAEALMRALPVACESVVIAGSDHVSIDSSPGFKTSIARFIEDRFARAEEA